MIAACASEVLRFEGLSETEMRLAIVGGSRVEAQPGLRGACPGCGGEVYAKCGEVLVWHWAHVTAECDSWTEPESEWHLDWKSRFPVEFQEVSLGEHRADVKGPGAVLEVQRSAISVEAIREREEFYGEMYWVLKGDDFIDRFSICYLGDGYYGWRWKMPRKSWEAAEATIVIDLPYGLFVLGPRDGRGTPWTGRGWFLTSQELHERVCGPGVPVVDHPWHQSDALLQARRARLEGLCSRLALISTRWFEELQSRYRISFLRSRGIGSYPSWLSRYVDEGLILSKIKGRLRQVEMEADEWEALLVDAFEFEQEERAAELERKAELAKLRELAAKNHAEWRKQQVLEAEERERLRIEQEIRRTKEAEEARRRSQEEYEALLRRRQEEAERAERAERAKIRVAELLQQAQPLVLEWRRGDIIEEFLRWRGAPTGGFGRLETEFIESCIGSFEAAGKRGTMNRSAIPRSSAPQPQT